MVKISERFLDDIDFCLHLYHCFYEAGDEKMYGSIARAEAFNGTIIENIEANSPNEIECLSLFLTTSHHQTWAKVNFGFNHIDYIFYTEVSKAVVLTLQSYGYGAMVSHHHHLH